MSTTLISAIVIILVVILLLVALLLILRTKLIPQGNVKITINDDIEHTVPTGGTLISTLGEAGVHLPSACGGKGSCGQCKCRVVRGGGSILPTEVPHFTRKQIQEGWRLGCQVKVKEDLSLRLPESILNVKEYECTVVSNRNVATFIKEFKVQLPAGEHMDFVPGSYAQIKIPTFRIPYSSFDRSLIGDEYLPAWEKFKMFDLVCVNTEPTVRAYSMANYPAEGDVFMLTVRIATPPFTADRSGFQNVNPGIASSYIFSLKPGDKVIMSGPYGEFRVKDHSNNQAIKQSSNLPEMIWVGGGAGMAPLRSQIMHILRGEAHSSNQAIKQSSNLPKMSYFYGARALNEVFYLQDFLQLEKDFPNFSFHLALDRPDPTADAAGVKYTAGFVHNVMYETYLKDHPAPEDIEYYMCGPGPMSKAVVAMLDSLGVQPENIAYDDFGG
ncbi:MAG: NADH:ubiquinone reductase (Na(+)-transporting) subunit F [Bacteroidales bacterium]|nr:NADH:ubiquinone reductase (Na(+)-transporting) subunit F [Bacteroidales bacterium]